MFDLCVVRLEARSKLTLWTYQVRVMIGGTNFYGGRKVEDNAVVVGRPRSPPSCFHGLANPNSEVWLRLRESLRTVFVSELCSKLSGTLVGQLADEFRMFGGQFYRLFL